jgi:hypothetical protein
MESLQESVSTVVRDVLMFIATNTEYEFEIMEPLMKAYMLNHGQCDATTKSGTPCTHRCSPGLLQCKKHVNFTPQIVEKLQCEAMNCNGTQCIRDAKINELLCGVHIDKIRRQNRKTITRLCVYYEENEETNVFCSHNSVHDKWCCKKHIHLQTLYAKSFHCENLNIYVNQIEVKRNALLDERLKTN